MCIPNAKIINNLIIGLCYGSSFDAHYGWTGEYSENTEIYYFRGFSNSLLVYDQQKSEWKLTLYSNPNIYATCNESTYPFGMLNWYFFNDTCQRIGSEQTVAKNVYRLPINFNGCNSNYEYNCLDGTWWVYYSTYVIILSQNNYIEFPLLNSCVQQLMDSLLKTIVISTMKTTSF